jgi:hypothetical protein
MSFLTLHAFLSLSLFLVSGFQFQIPLFPFPFTFFQFASFAPTHVTLRVGLVRILPRMSHPSGCDLCSLPHNRPVAWFPTSTRWHVFRFQIPLHTYFRFPVSALKLHSTLFLSLSP